MKDENIEEKEIPTWKIFLGLIGFVTGVYSVYILVKMILKKKDE